MGGGYTVTGATGIPMRGGVTLGTRASEGVPTAVPARPDGRLRGDAEGTGAVCTTRTHL